MFLLRTSTELYGFRLTALFGYVFNVAAEGRNWILSSRLKPASDEELSPLLVDKEHGSVQRKRTFSFMHFRHQRRLHPVFRIPNRTIHLPGLERVECVWNGFGPQSSRFLFFEILESFEIPFDSFEYPFGFAIIEFLGQLWRIISFGIRFLTCLKFS